jgi:hypothetical protein
MVTLTPQQHPILVESEPEVFRQLPAGRGRRGSERTRRRRREDSQGRTAVKGLCGMATDACRAAKARGHPAARKRAGEPIIAWMAVRQPTGGRARSVDGLQRQASPHILRRRADPRIFSLPSRYPLLRRPAAMPLMLK